MGLISYTPPYLATPAGDAYVPPYHWLVVRTKTRPDGTVVQRLVFLGGVN